MKKTLTFVIIAFLALAVLPFTASAEFSKAEKNVGRILICPFKAVGAVVTDIGQTLTLQKPTAILAIPKHVRQQATDLVESAGRTIASAEPIGADENGAVTNWVADNGLDPVVDFIVYGVVPAIAVHNNMEIGETCHYLLPWKVLGIAGGSVAAADVIDDCVDK